MDDGVIGSQMSKGDKQGVTDDLGPPSPLADVRLGRMAIRDGIISYTDERTGRKEELSKVVASFDWTTTSQMAAGDGSFIWRGEPVEFNGSIDAPLGLLAGGSSTVRFAFSATPLRLAFTGNALQLDGTQLEGDIKLTTPSVRRVVEWMGRPHRHRCDPWQRARSRARSTGSAPRFRSPMRLSNSMATPPRARFPRRSERRSFGVSGTLAFDSFDLSPYIEAACAWLTSAGVVATGAGAVAA